MAERGAQVRGDARLPNFFVVGAPKAGTTSLHAYLDQHPQIYMSPLKETHYFACEFRAENFPQSQRARLAREMAELREYLDGDLSEQRFGGFVTQWDDYLKLFRNVSGEIAVGEATPGYLWSPSAARNIAGRFPGAKIVLILRNPVDRAFSQYLHMASVRVVPESFGELIRASLECTSREVGGVWTLTEFGRYCGQVERYLQLFPRSQIHIALYEDLVRAPRECLASLYEFLGVDRSFVPDLSRRSREAQVPRMPGVTMSVRHSSAWRVVRKFVGQGVIEQLRRVLIRPRHTLEMEPAVRRMLASYYREDIGKLAVLIRRDLSAWLEAGS